MTIKNAFAIVCAILAAGVLVFAEDLGIQTGTWEFKMSGFSMDGVPPAMRAQIEAEMSKPYRSCVTADDIRKIKFGKTNDDDDEECKVTSSRLTRTGGDVTRQCEDGPETVHIEAPNPQTVKTTITKSTGSMTVNGKWLMAQCRE